jgi:hypothetical protein
MRTENSLVISDLQIPFEHPNALKFCKELKRFFRISDDNVYNAGDETDQYFGSMYKKSPDARHSPNSELKDSIDRMMGWYDAFPKMKLAISNHGTRWAKKAAEAEIPSQLLRKYEDVIQAPTGWQWKSQWIIRSKYPWRLIHGMGYSGQNGHRTAAMDGGMSTAIGHLHSHAGVAIIRTSCQKIWGMNTGCLIDEEQYAFEYGRDSRFKPCLGAGVVIDQGRAALWVPME